MWLLLVEDEARLAESLKRGLEEEGYRVDIAPDGWEGEAMGVANTYDAAIVDWRLPRQDGKVLIQHLRENDRRYPVIMLTALGDLDHRIEGLDAGADDYLTKPFSFEELLARLRALLRRPPLTSQEVLLSVGPIRLDTSRRLATYSDRVMNLRPKEYALLELFMRRPGEVISRAVLAERVWQDAFVVSENAMDVTISGLRQKLADVQSETGVPVRLETVRGIGYRLTSDEDGAL